MMMSPAMTKTTSIFAFATVLILLAAGPCCHGHPTWARNKTLLCTTLEPGHGSVAQPDSTFSNHFTMTASEEKGGVFSVRIDALDKAFGLVGYMIQARDACTGEILSGNWNTAQADQIMICNTATNGINSVHHRPRRNPAVPQVKHAWVPTNGVTSLQFMATVVHDKDTFWVRQAAPVLPCKSTSSSNNGSSPPAARSIPVVTRPAPAVATRPAPVRPAPVRPILRTRSTTTTTTTTTTPASSTSTAASSVIINN